MSYYQILGCAAAFLSPLALIFIFFMYDLCKGVSDWRRSPTESFIKTFVIFGLPSLMLFVAVWSFILNPALQVTDEYNRKQYGEVYSISEVFQINNKEDVNGVCFFNLTDGENEFVVEVDYNKYVKNEVGNSIAADIKYVMDENGEIKVYKSEIK